MKSLCLLVGLQQHSEDCTLGFQKKKLIMNFSVKNWYLLFDTIMKQNTWWLIDDDSLSIQFIHGLRTFWHMCLALLIPSAIKYIFILKGQMSLQPRVSSHTESPIDYFHPPEVCNIYKTEEAARYSFKSKQQNCCFIQEKSKMSTLKPHTHTHTPIPSSALILLGHSRTFKYEWWCANTIMWHNESQWNTNESKKWLKGEKNKQWLLY